MRGAVRSLPSAVSWISVLLLATGVAFGATAKAKPGAKAKNAAKAKAQSAPGEESSNDPARAIQQAKPVASSQLNPLQIQQGWIMLFDGQTTFGWKTEGKVSVTAEGLELVGPASIQSTTEFGYFELIMDHQLTSGAAKVTLDGQEFDLSSGGGVADWKVEPKENGYQIAATFRALAPAEIKPKAGVSRTAIAVRVPADAKLTIRRAILRPLAMKSLFNGKDLTGWKEIPGHKSVFTVTPKGELNIKNGNGEIQTEGQWDDFVLQLDVFSNGPHLNSGVFFRCLPGEFWQGYEAQIRNQWEGQDEKTGQGGDRNKPVDYGTGGVYNRQKSRKVVSSDKEWFTYTIVAGGKHIAMWVNGYQTADYVDEQPPAESARKGSKLGKGNISLQGHDPTTDLSFRNIRISEISKAEAK